ncbi:MAG: YicC family protein [Rhodobacteraceae bacterium]|nr:YicC family protein [Paracoccaceae bacterium]
MTGFAARQGSLDLNGRAVGWHWEVRAVNGRGRDLRLRLPEAAAALEPAVRAAVEARVARGSVTVGLRLEDAARDAAPVLDRAVLGAVLDALGQVRADAGARGIDCRSPSAAEILGLRGVLAAPGQAASGAALPAVLASALLDDLGHALGELDAARGREGAALAGVLGGQIDRIAALTADARALLDARAQAIEAAHRAALDRLARALPQDEGRMAQELAQLAVRLDVAEELDRLEAHCAAARALVADTAPAGRRLDFLCQEFNREANTLCAKAQYLDLTRVGLDLKAVIDQMREQIQNVE